MKDNLITWMKKFCRITSVVCSLNQEAQLYDLFSWLEYLVGNMATRGLSRVPIGYECKSKLTLPERRSVVYIHGIMI